MPYYTNTVLTTSSATTTTNLVYSPVYETFRYEPAYKVPPERAVDVEKIGATTETDMAWLKRRVREISWVPA